MNKHLTPWATETSRSSWTWTGYEGKPCVVEVFSDAEEVELICNGRSLGKKAAGERVRFRTYFETVYEPGSLCAVAYNKNGEATEEFVLRTAGDMAKLEVVPDRTKLKIGWSRPRIYHDIFER